MTNPQKVKGDRFENDVVRVFRANGHPHAERCYGAGRPQDVGDIDGIPGFVIECKNHARLELGPWMDEVERERVAGRQPYGVVVAKRRGKPVGEAFVVLSLESFARLVSDEPAPNPSTVSNERPLASVLSPNIRSSAVPPTTGSGEAQNEANKETA